MADPIGVVGTAVGIVSFGLQLYSAVATYIDALDGRRDELASARAKLDSLRDSLTTIQSALPSSPSASTGTSTIPSIVTECKVELDQLEVLLQDLVGSNASGNKLKERIKTLKFPFRRDSLMKLEDRLHKTNSVFQTALSVLNLNKSLDNERRFANVEVATAQIPAINANVAQISTDVQDLRVDVGYMSSNMNSAISTMNPNKNNEVISRLDLSVTQLTAMAGQSLPQISNSVASIERQMQNFSALEERLQTLSLLEQALGIEDATGQANTRLALQRLLSKPSQTREIYDGISHSKLITTRPDWHQLAVYDWPNDTLARNQSCSCRRRNNRRRTSQGFHPWLRTEMIHDEHDQDCELSKLGLRGSRRRFELTATRPFSFLPWSLGFSFALTTGAGGFSISPSITFRPIIDAEKSPVFRILSELEYFWTNGSYTDTQLFAGLSATKNTILELYCQKKAFANEAVETSYSRITAISIMIDILMNAPSRRYGFRNQRNQEAAVERFSDMIVELVQAGLPVDDYDPWGSTTVIRLALADNVSRTKGLLPVLYRAALDSSGRYISPALFSTMDLTYYRNSYDTSSKSVLNRIRAEIFDCGPLSMAITTQEDEEQIIDFINTNNISEVNSFGQTPLHLAAGTGKAEVLSALLRVEGTHDIRHARDTSEYHAIEYAAFYSGVSCYNGKNPAFCSKCCCTATLDALLCAEGFFDGYLNGPKGRKRLSLSICHASQSSKLRLLNEIKLRRDELKQLGLSHLEIGEIHRYKLDGDGVLDHYGIRVIKSLTEMGIEVPARIQNSFFSPDQGPSIYRMPILSASEAQLLFDLGFRDIDEPDELGFTPLMMRLDAYMSSDAKWVLWLVEHGADLARILPDIGIDNNHICATGAHLMAQKLASLAKGSHETFESEDIAHIISKNIAPVSTVDGCECYCTETGCTPASILLSYPTRRTLWEDEDVHGGPFRYWHQRQKATVNGASRLVKFLEGHDFDMTIHQHACLAALRMLTFEALGIRHTCGCRDWDNDSLSGEDVEDIWEEDAHLIDRLNELQTEFETRFDESGMSFNAFLVELWAPRMEIVFRELDQVELSEAERGNAESLGVKWDSCEVQYGPQQGIRNDDVFRRPWTLQEYLRAIRKIAEE